MGQRLHLWSSAGMNGTDITFGEGNLGKKCPSGRSGEQKPPSCITKYAQCTKKKRWQPLLPMTCYCGAHIKDWWTGTTKRKSLWLSGAPIHQDDLLSWPPSPPAQTDPLHCWPCLWNPQSRPLKWPLRTYGVDKRLWEYSCLMNPLKGRCCWLS